MIHIVAFREFGLIGANRLNVDNAIAVIIGPLTLNH
jgi:hypothetical protein